MEPKYASDARKRINLLRLITNPITDAERVNLTVENLGKGALIEFRGERFLVASRNRYEETWNDRTMEWYELELVSLITGHQVFLEFEMDDKLELSLWSKKLKLNVLGITPSDLDYFDDEEEGEFSYDGLTFVYADSGDATFFKADGSEGEPFYYYDFEAEEDSSQLISCERWGDSFEAGRGEIIDEREILILATGEE